MKYILKAEQVFRARPTPSLGVAWYKYHKRLRIKPPLVACWSPSLLIINGTLPQWEVVGGILTKDGLLITDESSAFQAGLSQKPVELDRVWGRKLQDPDGCGCIIEVMFGDRTAGLMTSCEVDYFRLEFFMDGMIEMLSS